MAQTDLFLKRIRIRNFQSLEMVDIQITNPVCIITGTNNIGKSATLRALRWCLLNQGDPKKFLRKGAKDFEVELQTQKGSIRRHRNFNGATNNIYWKDYKYSAVRKNIPPEVSKDLNVSEENFQQQLDGLFWLSESGGNLSRRLNELVDLSKMDRALGCVRGKIGEFQKLAKHWQVVYLDRLALYKRTNWAIPASRAIDSIRGDCLRCRNLANTARRIDSACQKVSTLDHTIRIDSESILRGFRAMKSCTPFSDKFVRWKGLVGMVESLQQRESCKDLVDLCLETCGDLIKQSQKGSHAAKRAAAKLQHLVELKLIQEALGASGHLLHDMNKRVIQLQRKVGVCPTCGNSITS